MPSMNKQQKLEALKRFSEAMPNPKTELNYTNPYTLLVAVTLSAQATDISVNKATKALFEIIKTPQDMVKLGLDSLISHIKTIGLYNSKAKNVMQAAQILIAQYDGIIPQTRAQLEQLPGVGRKTANVVLNVAFHQPTIAVDTHIFRLSNRTGLAPGKNPLEVELALEKVIPTAYKMDIHHWLILHGRYVCKARKPECHRCLIADLCDYNRNLLLKVKLLTH